MRRCPQCGQTYTDPDINFCLNDGELLSRAIEETPTLVHGEPPPTVFMDAPRITDQMNRASWDRQYAPPAQWQSGQPMQQAPFGQLGPQTPNQTLAIVSMCLGIGSLTIGWCCSTGLLFSPAALITGFLALSQIKKDPRSNGGRGFALAGIITGAVFLAAYVLVMIFYGIAMIGGSF